MHMVSGCALDFAEALRRHESANDMPPTRLVAYTRKPRPDQREAALQSGLDDLLSLPPRMSALRNNLAAIGWATKVRVDRAALYQTDSVYDLHVKDLDESTASPCMEHPSNSPRQLRFRRQSCSDDKESSAPSALTTNISSCRPSPRGGEDKALWRRRSIILEAANAEMAARVNRVDVTSA